MSNGHITYRTASPADNSGLLELTRKTGMSGQIALRTDRDPDFFALMQKRGKGEVYIALEGKQVVGSICVTKETVWINKQPYPLFYISDFKVSPDHRQQGIGFELTQQVVRYLESHDADLAQLHVASGNKRPFDFFGKRGKYPPFENIGTYTIYQYLGRKSGKIDRRFSVEEIEPTPEVLESINSFYQKYQLSPLHTKDSLTGMRLMGCYELGILKAVVGITKMENIKQNVVLKLPWFVRGFRSLMNFLAPLTGTLPLPGVHEPIRMLYIPLLVVPNPEMKLLQAVFRKLRQEAYASNYPLFSMGLHEKDPLQTYIPKSLRITFRSVGMLVSMKNRGPLIQQIKDGIPFKDFSTV